MMEENLVSQCTDDVVKEESAHITNNLDDDIPLPTPQDSINLEPSTPHQNETLLLSNEIDYEREATTGVDTELRQLVVNETSPPPVGTEQTSNININPRQTKKSTRESYVTKFDNIYFRDHFSLENPSSHLSFHDHEAIVLVDNLEQITLEKKKDDDFTFAKQQTIASPGLIFLRILSTWFAFMMASFLMAFCIQSVLFLFLGLITGAGLTSAQELNFFNLFSTLLAIPVFTIGLSQIMVFAQTFVIDTWKGSRFLLAVTRWDSVTVDWVTFIAYLGMPIVTGSITLAIGVEQWWTITSIVWLISIFLLFIVFTAAVIYHEVKACLDLVRLHPELRNRDDDLGDEFNVFDLFYHLCLLRLKQKLSGYEEVKYIAQGCEPSTYDLNYHEIKTKESVSFFIGPFSRLTMHRFMENFYNVLDEPIRQYQVGDVAGFTTYVTKFSWGLESIFCRNRSSKHIVVIDGESALTKKQVKSSFCCFLLGSILILGVVLSAMLWIVRITLSSLLAFLVILLFFLVHVAIFYKPIWSLCYIAAEYRRVLMREDGKLRSIKWNSQSNALCHAEETFRLSEPKKLGVYWFAMAFVAFFFFFIPLISSFISRNIPIGFLFLALSVLTLIRDVCSVPACLREIGSLEEVQVNDTHVRNRTEWREKHRLGKILSGTSLGKRSNFWITFFFVLMLVIGNASILAAIQGGLDQTSSRDMQFATANDFSYEGSGFASCALPDNFKSPDREESAMIDFAFLAMVSEYDSVTAQKMIDKWFENDSLILDNKVAEFDKMYEKESAVKFTLIDFPKNDLKIVSIRGSKSVGDFLHDAQLWWPVMIFQVVQSSLPFGSLFTPALPFLIQSISLLEDKSIAKVSYYKKITSFVEFLQKDGFDIQLVGHSLGGGIAMISGAQTKVASVAISAPNNKLSRRIYDPKLSVGDLDRYTFNVVPDKDPAPRFDHLSQHYTRIKCRSKQNDFKNFCHMQPPTLCELLYTCGSSNRPIPCECVHTLGYEKPTSRNGVNFTDVCSEE